MIIGNIKIEKILNSNGELWYLSFKDLEDPGYEYREYHDGLKYYYRNGKPHREDGPARICSNGTEYWYKNGDLHREDGPAVIYSSGVEEWWANGKPITPNAN